MSPAAVASGMATDITIGGTAVDFGEGWEIVVPTSSVDVAPSATIPTTSRASVDPNATVTVTIDGTTVFEGKTRSGGTVDERGEREVTAYHAVRDVFEDSVSVSLTSPSALDVLQAALSAADGGGNYTIDYPGTAATLNSDYEVSGRTVKRVFRDMMDRTGRVWWVEPAGTTIHVEPVADRGLWKKLDATVDAATLQKFDEGSVDTVRNAVEVVGTGGEQVRATATDSTSISTYGRRPGNSPYNISYITTGAEAQAMADELLVPDPLPEGRVGVSRAVGDITQPLVNQTVDVADASKGIDADGLVIEQQTIQQGRAILQVGGGTGASIEDFERSQKSQSDTTEPGSVYNSDRIADSAVTELKLADGSVLEAKLADLSVSLQKLQDASIDTVKIRDGAIEAPKVLANTLTANEIAADTLTANEIAADTLTANEVATLDLETSQLFIGTDAQTGFQFDVSSTDNWVRMYPSSDGAFCQIGLDTRPIASVTTESTTATNFVGAGTLTKDESNSSFEAQPQGGNTTDKLAVTDYSSLDVSDTVALLPLTDQTGVVGGNGRSWEQIHAYEYIDAGTGNAINDGGDPLAGLSGGRGPPDHAKRTDEKGDVKGYSLTDMVRSAWDIIRAQQREIETQQNRIDELEERLSALEAQL